MNTIKFASLISVIATRFGGLSDDEIIAVAGKVQEIIEAEQTTPVLKVNLQPMFEAMLSNRKIDAIKIHRSITGLVLKESKDAIDSIMSAFQLNERPDAYRVYVDGGWIYFGKNDEEKANNEAVKVNSNVEALYNRT